MKTAALIAFCVVCGVMFLAKVPGYVVGPVVGVMIWLCCKLD